MCRHEQTTLPPIPASVTQARHWVTDLLGRWDLAAAADDLRLVVSELVGNAVLHARTVVQVALSIADGVLELSVRDNHHRSPRPRAHGEDEPSTGGRGLMLVEALSDEWGVAERMDGKEVWFRVAAPAGWRYARECVCAEPVAEHAIRTSSGRLVVLMRPGDLPGED